MRFYPINLDLKGKKILVVGAGTVALQKIEGLLQAGAQIHVVALQSCEQIRHLHETERLTLKIAEYQKDQLENVFLIFAATNDAETNRQIHQDGLEKKIWVNAVDQPAECDFIIPARVSRGDLLIAISSGGKAPFLSKILRKYFEKKIPPEWEGIMLRLVELREKMIQKGKGKEFAQYMDAQGEEISKQLFESPQDLCFEKIEEALINI